MKVLGVHSLTHDLGTALCVDGQMVYAAEEERFTRIKHHPGIEVEGNPPYKSLEWVLKEANLKLQEIDQIVHIGWPGDDFMSLDIIRERYRKFAKGLDPDGTKSVFVDHHLAHAASAFYASGFDDAVVLAIDGQGDWISTSLYVGEGRKLKKVDEYFVDQSLGFMYSRAARLLGLGKFGFGEGKLTALAAYGHPIKNFPNPVLIEGGRYRMAEKYYENTFVQFQTEKSKLLQEHKDFAATVQYNLEETVKHILTEAFGKYKKSNLAIAGGVALNCKMNGVLGAMPWVDSMYIQPAANDSGLCIGAAYLGASYLGDVPRKMQTVFLGPEIKGEDVAREVSRNNLNAKLVEDPSKLAADLLNKGEIVAWMHGRLEIGPRALGHRSLLGDPRSEEIKNRLNIIKQREPWRPVAPSIIHSDKNYCDLNEATEQMTKAIPMSELAIREIPGGVHVDGTARVQHVKPSEDRYFALVKHFESITGVPAVLNTSLNACGEPLCNSIEDGIKFFYTTPTDNLIIGDWWFRK